MNNNPNTDVTYCRSETCQNRCWRHISKWYFDKDKGYWLMENCEEERNRLEELLEEK